MTSELLRETSLKRDLCHRRKTNRDHRKGKIGQLHFVKFKDVCSSGDPTDGIKRQVTDGGKKFALCIKLTEGWSRMS